MVPRAEAGVGDGCTPSAHQFCVTNANDTADTGSPNYPGSLRKAMADANAIGGANTIGFAIAGSELHTITLVAQLPAISSATTALTIDGFSQPGSVQNSNAPDQGGLNGQPAIEIVGNGGTGFYYDCCAGAFKTLTFQGLVLHDFSDVIVGQAGNLTPKALINVWGCLIGTNTAGTAKGGNGNSGSAVRVHYDNAQIGGTQSWQRNLLSGNGGAGVLAWPSDTTSSVVIEGNLIGTDASGQVALSNGLTQNWPGVYIQGQARNVRVGCATAGNGCSAGAASRNVISGNRSFGVILAPQVAGSNFSNLEIKGNRIGVGTTGTAIPNGYDEPVNAQYGGGIQIVSRATDTTPAVIGGFGSGEGNLVASNHGPGINVIGFSTPAFFDTRGNLLHDNAGPAGTNVAIAQFAMSEPLANDADDPDAWSNFGQNWPEVLTAEPVRVGGVAKMRVTYRVRTSPANATYPLRIDFHYAINGGAGLLLAQDSYPDTANEGYVTKDLDVQLQVAGPGPWFSFWGPIVAIATSAGGYSSEISPVTNDWIFGDGFETGN